MRPPIVLRPEVAALADCYVECRRAKDALNAAEDRRLDAGIALTETFRTGPDSHDLDAIERAESLARALARDAMSNDVTTPPDADRAAPLTLVDDPAPLEVDPVRDRVLDQFSPLASVNETAPEATPTRIENVFTPRREQFRDVPYGWEVRPVKAVPGSPWDVRETVHYPQDEWVDCRPIDAGRSTPTELAVGDSVTWCDSFGDHVGVVTRLMPNAPGAAKVAVSERGEPSVFLAESLRRVPVRIAEPRASKVTVSVPSETEETKP